MNGTGDFYCKSEIVDFGARGFSPVNYGALNRDFRLRGPLRRGKKVPCFDRYIRFEKNIENFKQKSFSNALA